MKSIYVFESNGQFKIGVSQNVGVRLRSIAIGNPDVRVIYESEQIANAYKVERLIHNHFSSYRTTGEWFLIPQHVNTIETVKGFVEKYGVKEDVPKEEDKFTELLDRLFAEDRDKIAKMEAEIEKINAENQVLIERLRSIGWSDFSIQKVVDDAVRSVLP